MKTYTFRFREIERIAWNETKCVKDEIITGTIPQVREMLGLKEIESISWAKSTNPDSKPTRIFTPQRVEHFFNRKNLNKFITYIR